MYRECCVPSGSFEVGVGVSNFGLSWVVFFLVILCVDSDIFGLRFGGICCIVGFRIVKYVRVVSCSGVEMAYRSCVGIG